MDKLTQASINYIDAIESRLKLAYYHKEPVFIPSRVTKKNLHLLKDEIHDIFINDFDSLSHESFMKGKEQIQGIGFGLINDFERFIKIGLLYSNRVFLWDYLWGRVLNDIENFEKSMPSIEAVSKNLMKIKEAVYNGGIVIFPHPINWEKDKNKITYNAISELHGKPDLFTTTNYGFVSTMSVSVEMNLHPYTLLDENTPPLSVPISYNRFYSERKEDYVYNISNLLDDHHFELINDVSVNEFYAFLSEQPKFFEEFRNTFMIATEGLTESEKLQAFSIKKQALIENLLNRNKSKKRDILINSATGVTLIGALANIIFGATEPAPKTPQIIASIMVLSASLGKYIYEITKTKETNTLILGFEKLKEISTAKLTN